jgi:DnaK suppressor protein
MGAARSPNRFEARLRAERESLFAEIPRVGDFAEMFRRAEVVDPEDISVQETTRDVALKMLDRRAMRIALIDAAIERLSNGTYGACVECGERIGKARLNADPAVDLCIGCQQETENGSPARRPEI